MTMVNALKHKTLQQVEDMHEGGLITTGEMEEYIYLWNTSAFRYTHAFYRDGAIRQHDAEKPDPFGICKECIRQRQEA